jgi:MerR family mercuric resistance operon transcriptional regulator
MPWDHSTFLQNRKRRLTDSGRLERVCDETVALAIKQKLVSHHTTLDETLVQANASHKSFVPLAVFLQPAEYTRRIRSLDAGPTPDQDSGHPTVTFRGERRSNQTHGATTDPDAKLANNGHGTAARVGYTVHGLLENRHRLWLGITVASFRGPASETDGGRELLDRFPATHALRLQTVGADKGYVAKPFLTALFWRRIRPHIAAKTTGREAVHQRVRRLSRTVDYRRYPEDVVKRIRFVKRAQALGFTLEEIAELLRLEEARACAETRALVAHKIELIDRKLTGLAAMRKALAGLVQQCDRKQPAKGCPIIQVLEQD